MITKDMILAGMLHNLVHVGAYTEGGVLKKGLREAGINVNMPERTILNTGVVFVADESYDSFLDEVQEALDGKDHGLQALLLDVADPDPNSDSDEITMDDIPENELVSMFSMRLRDEINENIQKLGVSDKEPYLCIPNGKQEKPFVWNTPVDIGTSIVESADDGLRLDFKGNEPCLRYESYSSGFAYSSMGESGAIIPQSWCKLALKTKEFHKTLTTLAKTDKEIRKFIEDAKHPAPAR